jgi:hypothetical protein
MMDDQHRAVGGGLRQLDGQRLELCIIQLAVNLARNGGVHADQPEAPDAHHLVERTALGLASE